VEWLKSGLGERSNVIPKFGRPQVTGTMPGLQKPCVVSRCPLFCEEIKCSISRDEAGAMMLWHLQVSPLLEGERSGAKTSCL